VTIKFRTIHAAEHHFSAHSNSAHSAHAHAINHYGCSSDDCRNAVRLSDFANILHHNYGTHDNAAVKLFFLEQIFQEVKTFVGVFAPLLATAMHLRALPIPDAQFYEQAARVKTQIIEMVHAPAQHLAIGRIQGIFHDHQDRMYRWAEDRRIPADNNLSERDLRLLVVARKVSFGSQSEAGANTRGILMTVLHTLKKRSLDACAKFKAALDHIAKDPTLDPFALLFPDDTS